MSTERERLERQERVVTDGATSQRYQELGENRITEEEEGLASEQEEDPTSNSKGGCNEDAKHL